MRNPSLIDHVLAAGGRALSTVAGAPVAMRPNPAERVAETELTEAERQHAAGLMRVNHVGEVCAQALYEGQAMLARDPAVRRQMQSAADEEGDHLAWTKERLDELGARPSLLNPLWYAGAFAMGALAARLGDRVSLGFLSETERQVERHLAGHLDRLPASDARSRAIVQQMRVDEARHAEDAEAAGAVRLPQPVPTLMRGAAKVMTSTAYYI